MPAPKRKSAAPSRYDATPPPLKRSARSIKLHARGLRSTHEKDETKPALPARATPVKTSESKTLPALDVAEVSQHVKLKSVAESGLLETTLHQSKAKWLAEGVLKKYWSKPSKRKDFVADPNNPAKETMSKLGPCRIVVEPHIFEATLFTIREPGATPPAPTPALQMSPQTTGSNQAAQTSQSGTSNTASNSHQSSTFSSPAPVTEKTTPHPTPATRPPPMPVTSQLGNRAPPVSSIRRPAPPPSLGHTKPTQDPVIQMLATRASQDVKLKELMKIVASGSANVEQLAEFQRHIDELTAILAKQREEQRRADTMAMLINSTSGAGPSLSQTSSQQKTTSAAGQLMHPPFPAGQYQSTPSAQSTASAKPKAYHSAPNVTGICIEFVAGSGDRYLLPRHTLLDYLSNSIVLASFLVVRKGSLGEEGKLDPDREYYQPITLRIESSQLRVLQTLARGVVPYNEALSYLQETMNKYEKAPEVRPSLQLADENADGESPATPSIATDRRVSLLKAATTAGSSVSSSGESTPRGKKAQLDVFVNCCRYCYATVPSPQIRDEDGKPVCASCQQLRQARTKGMETIKLSGTPARLINGPQALVLR